MRDYKSQTSRSRPSPPRRPAAKRGGGKGGKGSGGSAPGLLWLAAGLTAGLFIAFLVYLGGREEEPSPDLRVAEQPPAIALSDQSEKAARPAPRKEAPKHPDKDVQALLEQPLPPPALKQPEAGAGAPDQPTAAARSPKADKPAAKKEAQEPATPQYEFYNLLPNMEVEVPADALDTAPPPPPLLPELAGGADDAAEGAAPLKAPTPTAQLAPGEYFIIQAGAYRSPKEAEAVSAKLALLGLEAKIQPVDIPGQGKWYRVRSGPYYKADEAQRAVRRAQGSGARIMVIKTR